MPRQAPQPGHGRDSVTLCQIPKVHACLDVFLASSPTLKTQYLFLPFYQFIHQFIPIPYLQQLISVRHSICISSLALTIFDRLLPTSEAAFHIIVGFLILHCPQLASIPSRYSANPLSFLQSLLQYHCCIPSHRHRV